MRKAIFAIAVLIISATIFLGLYSVDRKADKAIKATIRIMDKHADSALNIINSINPDRIRSDKQFAEYALYLTQARSLNHIDETSDSLINRAVNYYDSNPSSNPYERMLAHYYSGVIQTNAHKYSDAITNLIKAAHLAEDQNQTLWFRRAQSKIAEIYSSIFTFSETAKYDSLAYEIGYNVYDKYHRSEIDVMALDHQNDVLRLTGLIILIIAGGILTVSFVNLNRKMQKRKDEQIIALAEELEAILNNMERKQPAKGFLANTTPAQDGSERRFSISRTHLDTIRLLCETYYESNQKESIKSKTAQSVEQEIKNFVNNPDFPAFLESLADSENEGIMSRFRAQMPGLTDKEYHIFLCSSLKLPVPMILMFYELNRNTLYTIRRRMRQKITDAHPIDEKEFLSYL